MRVGELNDHRKLTRQTQNVSDQQLDREVFLLLRRLTSASSAPVSWSPAMRTFTLPAALLLALVVVGFITIIAWLLGRPLI